MRERCCDDGMVDHAAAQTARAAGRVWRGRRRDELLEAELAHFDRATGTNDDSARIWRAAEELTLRYPVDSAAIDLRSALDMAPESGVTAFDPIRRAG